jgi:hypothetical protein
VRPSDFYRRLVAFDLRGRMGHHMAFLDAGDQFIALSAPRTQPPDEHRHFGLVVDDREAVRTALEDLDARGALRDWQITDPETNAAVALRVAYIHSSEEAREVAAARERALTKAEQALGRVQRGLGGRYYKHPPPGREQDREDPHRPPRGTNPDQDRDPRGQAHAQLSARPRRDRPGRPHRRRLRAGEPTFPGA